MFKQKTYVSRRTKLKKKMKKGLLLFIGNDETGMNYADNTYHFRQDSTFLYFFGLSSPGLNAIIDVENDKEIIFGDELGIDSIVWMGAQPTLHERAAEAGITDIRPAKEIDEYLKNAQKSGCAIHYLPSYRAEHRIKLYEWLKIQPGAETPSVPFIYAVINQRNYKSREEVDEIRFACLVTSDMHMGAITAVAPNQTEQWVANVVQTVASREECGLSFPTIATINGQTLHNHYHGNTIKAGDMVLVDAGAETPLGYAGDMSSTIPAGDDFTLRQREIYYIAVDAHQTAVNMLRPGVNFEKIYDAAAVSIMKGLKELGLAKGDPEEAVAAGAHAMFFPCGLGHLMGLDVHDMENLGEVYVGYNGRAKSTQFGRKSLRLGRDLEAGFVLTIEPGIYFIPELIDYWKSEKRFEEFINYEKVETYKDFGGIRNEEDYLITAKGAELLGRKVPLTPDEYVEFIQFWRKEQ
jgi:Xaa-Pro aminopeptidase